MDSVKETPFPAPSRFSSSLISGIPTTASATHFADRVLITISQDGALSQWIQVPLMPASPALVDGGTQATLPGSGMLPLAHLDATTLLGARGGDRETLGHGLATQLASRLVLVNPEDRRVVLLGLGLRPGEVGRTEYFDLVELGMSVL